MSNIICEKCKHIIWYNSYFNGFYCTNCGNFIPFQEKQEIAGYPIS